MCNLSNKFFHLNDVTICSAWIQGGLTFIAGAFVLWAAYFTYKPIKDEKKAKRIAYSSMMSGILSHLLVNINEHSNADDSHDLKIFPIPAEIELKNWGNHALFHPEQVLLLIRLVELLEQNNLYAEHDKLTGPYDMEHMASPDRFKELRTTYIWSENYLKYKSKCLNMTKEKFNNNRSCIVEKLNELILSMKCFIFFLAVHCL